MTIKSNRILSIFFGFTILAIILSACGDSTPTQVDAKPTPTARPVSEETKVKASPSVVSSTISLSPTPAKNLSPDSFKLPDITGLNQLELGSGVEQLLLSGSQRKTGVSFLMFASDQSPDVVGQSTMASLKKLGYRLAESRKTLQTSPDNSYSRGQYYGSGLPEVDATVLTASSFLPILQKNGLSPSDFSQLNQQIGNKPTLLWLTILSASLNTPSMVSKAANGVSNACPFSISLTLKEDFKSSYNDLIASFTNFLGIGSGNYAFFAMAEPFSTAKTYCLNEMRYRDYAINTDITLGLGGLPTFLGERSSTDPSGTDYQFTQFYNVDTQLATRFKENISAYKTVYIVYQTFKPGQPASSTQPVTASGSPVASVAKRTLSSRGSPFDFGNVLQAVFTPDGKTIIALLLNDSFLSGRAAVAFIDAATAKPIRIIRPDFKVNNLAISPDGKEVACGGDKGVLFLAVSNQTTNKTIQTTNTVINMAYSPKGTTLAVSDNRGITKLLDLSSGNEIASFQATVASFSPDGKQVVLGAGPTSTGEVQIVDLATKQKTMVFSKKAEANPVFSPDGTIVASVSSDGLTLWNAKTGTPLNTIPELKTYYFAVSSDGKLVANVANGYLTVRDIASGQAIASASIVGLGGTGGAPGLIFAPDGKSILATGTIWDLK